MRVDLPVGATGCDPGPWRASRVSVTLSVGTPLCPYGLAYRRVYGEPVCERWRHLPVTGDGPTPDEALPTRAAHRHTTRVE
jgi:hypothetical protein